MRKPYFCAVIGKGFGDEGKGMAVDFLSSCHENVLVIRHNGGAQSGHTVEMPDKRFVFHELSSGSFRHTDTFWADTYFPDIYKLGDEVSAFRDCTGFIPNIYADANVAITIIDDVLLNMAAENARGANRHGSCGMGIYEAQCRTKAGFGITVGDIFKWSERELVNRLQEIRERYLPKRLKELDLCGKDLGEHGEMLKNDAVLENVSKEILENIKFVKITDDLKTFICGYDKVIFENGQGLLLDSENEKYSPHVTASRTGLVNPCNFLNKMNFTLDEVVYVTRSYVTRHGAGPLPNECTPAELGINENDKTNLTNPWQGSLRYAWHEKVEEFVTPIMEDLKNCNHKPICSLLVTHLNETNNSVLMENGNYEIERFCEMFDIKEVFDRFYLSDSRYAKDIWIIE